MEETYGVEEDETLVEHLQRGSQLLVVLLELSDYVLRLFLRQLDEETLVGFDVESRDVQVALVGRNLYQVIALAELLAALVEHDSILVQVLRLSDHGDWADWAGRSPAAVAQPPTRAALVHRVEALMAHRPTHAHLAGSDAWQ